MRFLLALAILVAVLASRTALAADDLYQAQAIVTGEGEAERARGFALCLETVLVKVSGDPRLIGTRDVEALKNRAATFVSGFAYRDRMSGIPVHDEQGTRERPFDLTVDFDPPKIDAALATLGRVPWREPRPRLVVLLGVRDAQTAYVLAEDGERGLGERQSLAATAAKRGIAVSLPSMAMLGAEHVAYADVAKLTPARSRALAAEGGGDVVLAGMMVWTEAALGWTARWSLSWRGRERRWEISGVSFDDAFRDAIDGVVAVLSGHALPRRQKKRRGG